MKEVYYLFFEVVFCIEVPSLELLHWIHAPVMKAMVKLVQINRTTPIKYKANLSQEPKAQLVLFVIALLKLIILSHYFYIRKIKHWNDPVWHLEDFYLCIFSSGLGILFEYISLTFSSAKNCGSSCKCVRAFGLYSAGGQSRLTFMISFHLEN